MILIWISTFWFSSATFLYCFNLHFSLLDPINNHIINKFILLLFVFKSLNISLMRYPAIYWLLSRFIFFFPTISASLLWSYKSSKSAWRICANLNFILSILHLLLISIHIWSRLWKHLSFFNKGLSLILIILDSIWPDIWIISVMSIRRRFWWFCRSFWSLINRLFHSNIWSV